MALEKDKVCIAMISIVLFYQKENLYKVSKFILLSIALSGSLMNPLPTSPLIIGCYYIL